MRQQHYQFAHVVLRDAVLSDPDLWWGRLRSAASETLASLWAKAGEGLPGSERVEATSLDATPMPVSGGEALLVSLPAPASPTECHHMALVRPAGGRVRYFVMEMGLAGPDGRDRAYWAEWRITPGGGLMRIRGADLPTVGASAFLQAIEGELGNLFAEEPGPTQVQVPKKVAAPGAAPSRKKPVVLATCAAAIALGAWLLYQEELRGLHVPDDPVAGIAFEPDKLFQLPVVWEGHGYAFNNVWLVIEEGEAGPEGIHVRGKLRWSRSSYEHAVDAAFPGKRGSHRVRSENGKVSGWLYLGDEYSHSSPTPMLCSGSLSIVSGKIGRARVVVTQRQRPADWLHF